MRPVSSEINEALRDGLRNANFGLVFNKWLEIEESGRKRFKTTVHEDRAPLVRQYGECAPWNGLAAETLRYRHVQQRDFCDTMRRAGWTALVAEAKLVSPFVSGLGMTHPTETGMVLDWNTGLPYIPASSQKGVLRLAYVLDAIERDPGKIGPDACWEADGEFLTLFGHAADRGQEEGLQARLVVLDAYPLSVPSLGEDILNPHYPDYYRSSGADRGPTEDQNPNPVRFLVVQPGVRFVFRLLLRHPLAGDPVQNAERLVELARDALQKSLEYEGLGAKTSLGYGRFKINDYAEPAEVEQWRQKCFEKKFPWLPLLTRIKEVEDWGQLKQQVLESDDARQWQERRDVAETVKKAALRVRERSQKKWTAERDELIAAWLAPAGLDWPALAPADDADSGGELDDGQVSPLLAKIRAYADWGTYKNDPVEMKALDRPCSLALQLRFREWGCNAKRARREKSAAWKALQKHLRSL